MLSGAFDTIQPHDTTEECLDIGACPIMDKIDIIWDYCADLKKVRDSGGVILPDYVDAFAMNSTHYIDTKFCRWVMIDPNVSDQFGTRPF